jgi:SAM-dependent methyltransferase
MTFFDFGENNTNTLFNFLQDALAKNNEFEIRLGKFYHDKTNTSRQGMSFDSSVSIDNFYNLKKMFENQKTPKKITKTREYIYPDNKASIKKIVNLQDNSVTTMSKQSLRRYDVYDYDLRMSVASERLNVKIVDENAYTLVRTKNRTSYQVPFGSLDLTVVEQNDKERSHTVTKYEVELEIKVFNKDLIMGYLMVILQNRQDNFYVISGTERRRVMYEYKTMTSSHYFIGAQPETLHKERISVLYKSEYSVTDKADGDRAFMIVDSMGCVYIVDNNMNKVLKTDVKTSFIKASLIDGELVRYDNKVYFLGFDVLCYNGKDLRGDGSFDLRRRLQVLDEIVKNLSNSDYYNISAKQYYFGNVFSGAKRILDTVSEKFYENDGLIFTPVNEPYPVVKKWSGLLKWKPAELNTIDFYVKKQDNKKWNLYVQGEMDRTSDKKNRTTTVLFDIQKLCGEADSRVVTYETTFGDDLLDPTTGDTFKTDTVIEFRWDKTESKFVPLRTRWDKTVNPKKHGNFSKVACDIWNNINNPVEKDYLLKFYSNPKSSDKDVFFERMRRFHNKVKEYLYNKYCKDIPKLLELCSGRGGDMHKWLYNNVKSVTGYDISEKNIEECKRRVYGQGNRDAQNYSFYKLDLTRSDSWEVIVKNENNTQFDVVCCQFGVHYFFESHDKLENIVRILENSLKIGGVFVVTFMDNGCLQNLFGDKDSICYEKDGEIVYNLERHMTNYKFGNRLKISLNGNNILGEGSDEWIIDFENFVDVMKKHGFECIETELFSRLYNSDIVGVDLYDCEKHISFLNRYCVFRRKQVESEDLVVKKQVVWNYSIPSEYNFETVDLHQKNISVHKITSVYNIVDTINCIEYKYYKNNIENTLLDNIPEVTFPEIEKAFDDLKILYNPVFVSDPLDFSQYQDSKNTMYFTYHKHVVEKKEGSDEEQIEYNNWYIIMYNEALLFGKPHIETIESPIINTEIVEAPIIQNETPPQEIEENYDNKLSIRKQYDELKSSGSKITLVDLKTLLKTCNLKTSGKKDELVKRLEEFVY